MAVSHVVMILSKWRCGGLQYCRRWKSHRHIAKLTASVPLRRFPRADPRAQVAAHWNFERHVADQEIDGLAIGHVGTADSARGQLEGALPAEDVAAGLELDRLAERVDAHGTLQLLLEAVDGTKGRHIYFDCC